MRERDSRLQKADHQTDRRREKAPSEGGLWIILAYRSVKGKQRVRQQYLALTLSWNAPEPMLRVAAFLWH